MDTGKAEATTPILLRFAVAILAALVAFAIGAIVSSASPERADAAMTVSFKVRGTVDYGESYAFLVKLNKLRAKKGLSKLTMDKSLMKAAEQRAAEISVLFSHTRTNGKSCRTASKYISGENIAYSYSDATSAYEMWVTSPPHYKNMIKSSYRAAGVCCFERNGETYWVNLFGNGKGSTAAKNSSAPTKAYKVKLAKKYLTKNNLRIEPTWMEVQDTDNIIVYFHPKITEKGGILPNSLFKFKSSNAAVLSVSDKGKLASKALGKAKLTITAKGKSSCKLTQAVTVDEEDVFGW